MQLLVRLARLMLGCTFALSSIAKLAAPARTREGLVEFGIPLMLATPLAAALVIAEMAAAILVLLPVTARQGALAALILLSAFSVGIGVNLTRGRRPACNCFGQLRSTPIGWPTLVRNGVLAAIAVFVLSRGRP